MKEDKKYLLQTYAKNEVKFKRGINATLFDENNVDYIDFTSGIGVVSLGHANKSIAKEISQQAKKLIHTSNLFYNDLQVKLAKKIYKLSGGYSCFFSNSGAEANECAIKLARKYGYLKNKENKAYDIITLESSFHGRTLATLKATAQESFHKNDFSPYIGGFVYAKDIDDIENKINEKTVAVMIELIQGEGGVMAQDKKKVQKLAKLLKKLGILLIVDEVQSGVFRSGNFLASQSYGIKPDIITLAKAIANGFPMGATLSLHKDVFVPGDHGSTFGGTFLASRVALCTLKNLENLKKIGKIDENIKLFDKKLNKILNKYPNLFVSISGMGLMRGLKCKNDEILANIIKKSFDKKLLVLKSGRQTLRFLPPLSINENEVKQGFKRLQMALDEL